MRNVIILVVCAAVLSMCGCAPQQPAKPPAQTIDPRTTVGSIARIYGAGSVQVRGIGIVAGLAGTGSAECPPRIREELEKYIWKQIPQTKGPVNPGLFIESQNTAVVEVVGTLPSLSNSRDTFDIIVRPLSSTQTTSLNGGYLYTTELKEMSRLANVNQFTQYTNVLAEAQGPIYSNTLNPGSSNHWYVLGGGHPVQDSSVKLVLFRPDFAIASTIRNRINERFGPKTAIADSSEQITLSFPARYQQHKDRFLQLIGALILAENPEIIRDHIQAQVEQLASGPDKQKAELSLESIGKPALDRMAPLLDHPEAQVRFYTARCMLNIGDERPVPVLRTFIVDKSSPYRIEAIKAVGQAGKRSIARTILLGVLNGDEIDARLAAYEMLVDLQSPEISRKYVADKAFIVDSIICSGPPVIYAFQQGRPRIVIFGSPIECTPNIFIQSDDGSVTINAAPEDETVSVSRKHPSRPRTIGPLSSSRQVSRLIQMLGELPDTKAQKPRIGLAVPYAEILPLLRKMCLKNAIPAEFMAGPELTPEKDFQ